MSARRFPLRLAALSALAAAAATVLAGCGGGGGSGTPAAADATAGASGIPAGTVLRIGDQQQHLEKLFAASGQLTHLPYKVNFVEFDSGPLVDAGLTAGRIDAGSMGDLPATVAVSSHVPVKAVAVDLPIGASQYLLARPGITSLSQLRGRRVAYTTGTSEQAFALRALAQGGLTQADVHQVDVTLLQLGTVLQSGAADASVVSVQQKIDYQQTHPGAKVLANSITTNPPSYGYFLAADAALANPGKEAALADFVHRLVAASAWQKAHRQQWVNDYYVDVEHQTPSEARQILAAGGEVKYVPITSPVEQALQHVVDLMASAGAIPAPFSVSTLFDPGVIQRFNAVVSR